MKPFVALFVAFLAPFLSTCSADDGVTDVSLPETPVLSARESWGVVERPYVRVFRDADEDSPIAGHLRAGIVSEITARIVSPVNDAENGWVQIREDGLTGWVRRQEIELFDTRERAENAARAIRGD